VYVKKYKRYDWKSNLSAHHVTGRGTITRNDRLANLYVVTSKKPLLQKAQLQAFSFNLQRCTLLCHHCHGALHGAERVGCIFFSIFISARSNLQSTIQNLYSYLYLAGSYVLSGRWLLVPIKLCSIRNPPTQYGLDCRSNQSAFFPLNFYFISTIYVFISTFTWYSSPGQAFFEAEGWYIIYVIWVHFLGLVKVRMLIVYPTMNPSNHMIFVESWNASAPLYLAGLVWIYFFKDLCYGKEAVVHT